MNKKRCFDVCMSLLFIILFSPLIALISFFLWMTLKSPILFKQVRTGMEMQSFVIYKFRTMTDQKDKLGQLLPDAERLTSFGIFLRKTSLDELPQLYNVLRGDMSLVGPRPLLMQYNPYFSEREKKRFLMKPGITGLAQISGRNKISWEQRFELDLQYVEQWTFELDLKVIAHTALYVLRRKDVVESPSDIILDLDVERG